MVKTKKRFTLVLTTYDAKLKQKVWGIAGVIFLFSTVLIDVINVRTGTNQNAILLFIKNIHLIIPWGIAYLIAFGHRDLLKIFMPLYLSLALLASTVPLSFTSQSLEKKFKKEMANIVKDFTNSIDGMEPSSLKLSSTYSADEYGLFAVHLNKVKKSMESYKQETDVVLQAFDEVELDKVFTDEVLFNLLNIVEKKKKLEKLLLLLDESAKRTENTYSEYVNWVFFSQDIDEGSRKNLTKAIFTSLEENRLMRQEPYRIKKDIVQEYIKCLDFFSKIHGTYEKNADDQIICSNDTDTQILRSHDETLSKLIKEEENFALFCREKAKHIASSFTQ